MKRTMIPLLSCLALTIGCIDQEIEQTLYLEEDGTATWLLEITNLSPEDPTKALDQYLETLDEIGAGADPFQELMVEAGAWSTEVVILREEPPLRYQVSGRFASIDEVLALQFAEHGVGWESEPTREGSALRFRVPEEKRAEKIHPLELIVVGGKRYTIDSMDALVETAIALP